ncbi:MAG: hypothetical protein HYS13_18525 [Planctomycetia bacterium]|nr:hypothetical protein [Planctomycetia bacterium]
MPKSDRRTERILETMLVLIAAALACLLHYTAGMKMVVLNLFYLPVVLAGFFLGRYRAGALALLSVIAATIVVAADLDAFLPGSSPIMVALAVTVWGASLGLTAILVGTLCDERDRKAVEAHEAHVGVVEVLARYLQSANPRLEHQALRVARLSAKVGERMFLPTKEIDDIRVAALLIDMENIEITARVIRKAFDELEDSGTKGVQRTFSGTELVRSLGSTLRGAFPLLLMQATVDGETPTADVPLAARIIRTVRAYVQLVDSRADDETRSPAQAIDDLRCDVDADHLPAVLDSLETIVAAKAAAQASSPLSAEPVA